MTLGVKNLAQSSEIAKLIFVNSRKAKIEKMNSSAFRLSVVHCLPDFSDYLELIQQCGCSKMGSFYDAEAGKFCYETSGLVDIDQLISAIKTDLSLLGYVFVN